MEVQRNRLYEVDFDDGSVSDDLLPEDIVVSISHPPNSWQLNRLEDKLESYPL